MIEHQDFILHPSDFILAFQCPRRNLCMYGSSAFFKDSSVPWKICLPSRIIITLVLIRQRRSPSFSKTTSPASLTTAYSEQRYSRLFISCVTKMEETSSRSRNFI